MYSIQEVAEWFKAKQNIVVITGAGISTESGIPDFRSASGLYSRNMDVGIPMEEVLSRQFFERYPEEFYRIYKEKLLYPNALPNKGHYFLKELESRGHTVTIITQNIDGLHQKAGSTHVLELHGNANRIITKSGKHEKLSQATLNEEGLVIEGEWARPAITLYGEGLNEETLKKSIQAVEKADILLVMGTSLNVYPAAGLIFDYTRNKSALINKGSTSFNAHFDYVHDGSISEWVDSLTVFM